MTIPGQYVMDTEHTIVFDIDGTLIQSFEFDEKLYIESVEQVTKLSFDGDWSLFPNITDSGILKTFWENRFDSELPETVYLQVKELFVQKIHDYVRGIKVKPVAGAIDFFETIKQCPNTSVAFATGGWRETAELKLTSAGFYISGIELASSNDHHVRSKIMQIAIRDFNAKTPVYFGDGEWDKRACEELGWRFIAIGDRTSHTHQLADFRDLETLREYLIKPQARQI